jgi:hypothetical protein
MAKRCIHNQPTLWVDIPSFDVRLGCRRKLVSRRRTYAWVWIALLLRCSTPDWHSRAFVPNLSFPRLVSKRSSSRRQRQRQGLPLAQPPSTTPTIPTRVFLQEESPHSSHEHRQSYPSDSTRLSQTPPLSSSTTSRYSTPQDYANTASKDYQYLEQATRSLLDTPLGSLIEKGKWHQLVSLLHAWFVHSKKDPQAPLQMEALLKRLLDEKKPAVHIHTRPTEILVDIHLYNRVLDAWARAALFGTHGVAASQRARQMLVLLQENYEQTNDPLRQPTVTSFNLVLHVVTKIEGALVARRLLAWMEHLCKSGKNPHAQPSRTDYILVLDAIANSRDENAGVLAQGYLRHMKVASAVAPDTLCYNIAIKAWTKSSKRGRASAEHADRILEDMKQSATPPDLVTYASVIAAWASSGMKTHAVTRAEELLRELQIQADEDERNGGPLEQPNTVIWNAVMSTWVKSRMPEAVDRTREILTQLQMSTTTPPDLISFNTHLHALSMHAGRNPRHAQAAIALLEEMEHGHDVLQWDFKPNLFSYNLVIEAFCRSSDTNAVQRAADTLRKLVKRDGVDPDTFSFNQVLAALSKSGAAQTAEELLTYQRNAYVNGVHPAAKPDIISFTSVIAAHARSGVKGASEKAETLLEQCQKGYAAGDTSLKPNRVCYNALINGWAKSGEGTLGARKAEALLNNMQAQYEAGDESMKPNIVTYNGVLNAWARSGTRCCGVKAEEYLDRMWELYNAGDTKVKPDDFSYNTVINAISKSQNEGKAQKALRILRRMDKLYQAGNKEARPNAVTYTAVLNSCAFPAVLDFRTRRKALDTAIFTLEELQSSGYGQPNQVTYGTFIKACANLLHDDDDLRREVIERAFRQCCKAGQVGEMVLTYLRQAAPADLYEELLADSISSHARVSVRDLPEEWRCNVQDEDNWRVKPYGNRTRNGKARGRRKASLPRLNKH